MVYVVAGCTSEGQCVPSEVDFERYLSWPDALLFLHVFFQKSTLNAICRCRRYFCKSLFAFDAWFWRYMWCSRALGHFIVCIGCLFLMLFVVAGTTFRSHCFSSMLDFAGICRGRTRFWKPLLVFDAWFWCYLSWPEALLDFIVCLRCLILSVFVVFQNILVFYCLPSMLDSDAICRGRTRFWKPLLFFDAWFCCYLSWLDTLGSQPCHFSANQNWLN